MTITAPPLPGQTTTQRFLDFLSDKQWAQARGARSWNFETYTCVRENILTHMVCLRHPSEGSQDLFIAVLGDSHE